MNCKPCGIAIRGEKPKDNRTIWDFGGKRMLKISQFEFRGGQRVPDSEPHPVNFAFRKGTRVNNTNATFVDFHKFHHDLTTSQSQQGYRRLFLGELNDQAVPSGSLGLFEELIDQPVKYHKNKTMSEINEVLEKTEDRSLKGRIVKGYEPHHRPWMVFFQIATGNGLSLDI